MLIAICADSHDNEPNIEYFINFCLTNAVQVIFHCGDWCSLPSLTLFINKFHKPIYGVLGNADINNEELMKTNHINLQPQINSITLQGLNFALCHKPEDAKQLTAAPRYDYIFYGHTHKPWLEQINDCWFCNPGTLAGMFLPATFAVLNTQTRELTLQRL